MIKADDIIGCNPRAVSIHTTLHPLDRLALNRKSHVAGQFNMIADTYGLGPDLDVDAERLYNGNNIHKPGIPFQHQRLRRQGGVDRLFEGQRIWPTLPARKAVYDQTPQIIWHDLPVLPLLSHSAPNAFWSRRVTGLLQGA